MFSKCSNTLNETFFFTSKVGVLTSSIGESFEELNYEPEAIIDSIVEPLAAFTTVGNTNTPINTPIGSPSSNISFITSSKNSKKRKLDILSRFNEMKEMLEDDEEMKETNEKLEKEMKEMKETNEKLEKEMKEMKETNEKLEKEMKETNEKLGKEMKENDRLFQKEVRKTKEKTKALESVKKQLGIEIQENKDLKAIKKELEETILKYSKHFEIFKANLANFDEEF